MTDTGHTLARTADDDEHQRRRSLAQDVPKSVLAIGLALVVALALTAGTVVIRHYMNAESSVGEPLMQALDVSQPTTARVVLATTFAGAGAPASAISGQGVYDFNRGRGTFEMSVPGVGPTNVIVNASSLYLQQPVVGANGQVGWNKLDRLTLPSTTRVSVGFIDPATIMSYLNSAIATEPMRLGEESSPTGVLAHYQTSLDLTAGASVGQNVRKVATNVGLKTLPVDVWLDSSSRLRKVSFSIDLGKLTVARSSTVAFTGTVSYSMELGDFGTPVEVQLPDDASIIATTVVAP
ncbi:MAG: hypothetical protein QOK28_1264 [Actinomycetota bacterium]|jgi:hypothetical protein